MAGLGRPPGKCTLALFLQASWKAFERHRIIYPSSSNLSSVSFLRLSHAIKFKALGSTSVETNRTFHTSTNLSDQKKYDDTSENHKTDKEKQSSTLVQSQDQVKDGRNQISTKIRTPTAPQVIQKEEGFLPNHDPQRITVESRRFENKAVGIFEDAAMARGKNKNAFLYALKKYESKESLYRRGSLEMVYAGLGLMKEFGVIKDLDSYKALIQVFPEGKMIPRNAWQVEFMHYPRQQQCAIDLLEQMETNAVIPDDKFGDLLKNRFGSEAHATRKYRRMKYWLPKFKNINAYPIPFELPENPEELALIALRRMCVDKETKYKVWKTSEEDVECDEDTFIASAQSPLQQELLSRQSPNQPLFVEGPYPVYLRTVRQQYFLLRAEPNINALMKQKQKEKEEQDEEKLFEWTNFFEEEEGAKELSPILSVHEQEDSTILALCITGTCSKTSVVSWVRYLERENSKLADIPVLFKLSSGGVTDIDVIGDSRSFKEQTGS